MTSLMSAARHRPRIRLAAVLLVTALVAAAASGCHVSVSKSQHPGIHVSHASPSASH